ncbi:MAG: winged helix-turn-helix domain-containing protein [Anaerolinea sp.]|nr:winged helix-turn-helix domain-containing protein [Anaerolinea sp.]
MQLTLLGTFAAWWRGQSITGFPTDKVRALLAYLALEGERPLRRETLATLLWPDWPDDIARRNLRQNLHRLNQLLDALEPARLPAMPGRHRPRRPGGGRV